MPVNRLHPPGNRVGTNREGIALLYRIWRGRTALPGIHPLAEARVLAEDDIARHPEAVASLFGVFPGVRWTWDRDVLLARSNDNGAVAYCISPVAGT